MTITYFKELIHPIDNNRYKNEKEQVANVYHWGKHFKEYCDYLDELLQAFHIVVIKVNIYDQERYKTLTVDYLKGSSSVLLSDWCEAILLPEIEKIVANHNRRIVYNYITKNKAA